MEWNIQQKNHIYFYVGSLLSLPKHKARQNIQCIVIWFTLDLWSRHKQNKCTHRLLRTLYAIQYYSQMHQLKHVLFLSSLPHVRFLLAKYLFAKRIAALILKMTKQGKILLIISLQKFRGVSLLKTCCSWIYFTKIKLMPHTLVGKV